MKNIFFALLFVSLPLMAEVKPEGTILSDLCGTVNRSLHVCQATAVGSKSRYLVLEKNQDTYYARVTKADQRVGGSSWEGYYVGPDRRFPSYSVEHKIKLDVGFGSGAKFYGTLFIDGKKVGKRFEMEAVFHTQ